jgi:hypothetical protein
MDMFLGLLYLDVDVRGSLTREELFLAIASSLVMMLLATSILIL